MPFRYQTPFILSCPMRESAITLSSLDHEMESLGSKATCPSPPSGSVAGSDLNLDTDSIWNLGAGLPRSTGTDGTPAIVGL